MTGEQACERYRIPIEIWREYEGWSWCGTGKEPGGARQYDSWDIQRLSMLMTLHDIGFDSKEAEAYMRLLLQGDSTQEERIRMLGRKRERILDEIHSRQAQLDRLDYLWYKMKKRRP